MKKNVQGFYLRGYDRVMAIHKLKKDINKYGDKLGKKNSLLNKIKTKNIIGNEFKDLTINKIHLEEKKKSFKINILNKIIQNKNENQKDNNKIKIKNLQNLLDNEIFQNENINENDILSSSYDYKLKETDLFSKSNFIDSKKSLLINNNHSKVNINNNNEFSYLNLFKNRKKSHRIITKNITYNSFYCILNRGAFPINKNAKNDIQDEKEQESIIKPKFINNSLYNIFSRNKIKIPKFRSLKMGTVPLKVKSECKIVKLGRNFKNENFKQNDTNIKTRTLFYKKYKQTKDMKLTKIKMKSSRAQSVILDNNNNKEITFYKEENIMKNGNTKNFGQQTMNENYFNKNMNMNLIQRVYSYIKIPKFNRINFPEIYPNSYMSDCGQNLDF